MSDVRTRAQENLNTHDAIPTWEDYPTVLPYKLAESVRELLAENTQLETEVSEFKLLFAETRIKTRFAVVWFPPDAPVRERTYATESAARSFIRGGERDGYDVKDWNPILLRRTTTVVEVEIPLTDGSSDPSPSVSEGEGAG